MIKFDFDVRHIKGKENKVVDALSRRVHGLFEVNISRAKSDLEQKVRTVDISDGNCCASSITLVRKIEVLSSSVGFAEQYSYNEKS